MRSIKKAEKYVSEGKVFPILHKENFDYWCIEGKTGNWEVKHDKIKNEYRCNCPNVRLTPCCHILAVKMKYKEQEINYLKGSNNGRKTV